MSSVLPIAGAVPLHPAQPLGDVVDDEGDRARALHAAARSRDDDALPTVSQEALVAAQAQGLAQWLVQGPDLELGALPSRDLSSAAGAPKALPTIDPSHVDREHLLELRAPTMAGDWLSPTHAASHKPPTATPPGSVDLPTAASQGQRGNHEHADD